MKKLHYIFFALIFFMPACKKSAPQLPHNKKIAEDSLHIRLARVNETVAQNEDSVLQAFVNQQKEKYIKTPDGIWYYKMLTTHKDSLKKQQTAKIKYTAYTIDNKVIKSEILNFHFEKKEVTPGLEKGVELMRKGEKIKLIVPWNLAYGSYGKEDVDAYTSLIYEVESTE